MRKSQERGVTPTPPPMQKPRIMVSAGFLRRLQARLRVIADRVVLLDALGRGAQLLELRDVGTRDECLEPLSTMTRTWGSLSN